VGSERYPAAPPTRDGAIPATRSRNPLCKLWKIQAESLPGSNRWQASRRAGTLAQGYYRPAFYEAGSVKSKKGSIGLTFYPSFREWNAGHLAKSLLAGLDGDVRVSGNTIIVTYCNAPNVERLGEHYEHLPERLSAEHTDPHIPWLYHFELDFRFR
jgi:hypothetical protein